MTDSKKYGKLGFCMAVTFLWGIAAYGYRFFNLDFSHDSLLVHQQLDVVPMLSVGRFAQPVYFLLRGNLYAPALVGFLALGYIGVSVYWTAELLKWENRGFLALLSGVMTVNAVVTLTGATYIHDLDIYMLALLLAVWSVRICRGGKHGFLLAVVPEILSLGLYQSYIQVAILLHMVLAVLAILRQENTQQILAEGIKAVLSLGIALMLYYGGYRLALLLTGTAASTGYNAISGIDFSSGKVLRDLLYSAYAVFRFFAAPISGHPKLVLVGNAAIFGAAACSVGACIRKIRGRELALLAVLLAVMPFAINVTCILARGMVHTLMLYVCVLLYIFALECCRLWQGSRAARRLIRHLLPGVLAVIVLDGVIYANQVSLKKTLEYNSTTAAINRILDRIEQTDGYTYGKTPVAFVGSLYESPLTRQAADFDYTSTGLWHSYAVSFPETYEMYIHNVLNYEMRILPHERANALARIEAVRTMGIFPAKDSVQMLGSILVVKLSEVQQSAYRNGYALC